MSGIAETLELEIEKVKKAEREALDEIPSIPKSLTAAFAVLKHVYRIRFKSGTIQESFIIANDQTDATKKGIALAKFQSGGIFVFARPFIHNLPEEEGEI